MDIVVSYLTGPAGDFWGFVGIAIAFLLTALLERVTKQNTKGMQIVFCVTGAIWAYFAYRSLTQGITQAVDAGKVLGYLGIGTG